MGCAGIAAVLTLVPSCKTKPTDRRKLWQVHNTCHARQMVNKNSFHKVKKLILSKCSRCLENFCHELDPHSAEHDGFTIFRCVHRASCVSVWASYMPAEETSDGEMHVSPKVKKMVNHIEMQYDVQKSEEQQE